MAKYILKQAAIFALTNEANTHSNPVKRAYTRAAAIIEQITAEDVQPVKHGKWEQGKCTNCEKSLEDLFSGDFYWDDDELHFCPNCGARMDGDTECQ